MAGIEEKSKGEGCHGLGDKNLLTIETGFYKLKNALLLWSKHQKIGKYEGKWTCLEGGGGGWLGVVMLHNFASRVTRESCCCCCFFFHGNHVPDYTSYQHFRAPFKFS